MSFHSVLPPLEYLIFGELSILGMAWYGMGSVTFNIVGNASDASRIPSFPPFLEDRSAENVSPKKNNKKNV